MKNFLFGLMMLAGTSIAFANETTETKIETNSESAVTICYRRAVDDFGTQYLVRVPCPKVIILKAVE